MANQVYANNREIACKKASGKAICAFPDVCFTPPQTPATPPGVPIPYPNTGMASDTTKGSKKTKISGKEIMLKNQSHFKTSYGDEAGCAPKKGLLTSKNKGKIYFKAWSMDVKVEGKNAVRHLDLTTHNHASEIGQTPPWPYLDATALEAEDSPCAKYVPAIKEQCPPPPRSRARGQDFHAGGLAETPVPGPQDNTSKECCEARKCMLVPESPVKRCKDCGKTPHHPVPAAELLESRKPGERRGAPAVGNYRPNKAPCICAEGDHHDSREEKAPFRLKEHGRLGAEFAKQRNDKVTDATKYTFASASEIAAAAVEKITGCDKGCIKQQLDKGHEAMDVKPDDTLRMSPQKADVPETLPPSAAPAI